MAFYDINENEIEIVRGDRPYKEREGGVARHSLSYILGDLGDIKQKYFILGFHLNEFAENEYYKDFGYDSMKDFCVANIPIEYSSLSRCMTVHTHICERVEGKPWKKTNRMKEKYKEYGFSQLVELSSMGDDLERQCTSSMTVKEMRDLKKQAKEKRKNVLNNQEPLITDNCDVATGENEKNDNCDVATTENENSSVEETTAELSEKEIQGENKNVITGPSAFDKEMAYKTFISSPSNVVFGMFKRRFGDDLQGNYVGKMLTIKIPGYEVTIRISFKEIEETEE